MLHRICLQNVIDGLEGLQGILKKLQGISGYNGTVLDNLECSNSLFTAVEVTAGKR